MAVRFVIGRAGSGKTFRCFTSIVEAMRAGPLGPPIYWIVPRQATFMAERELTCNSGLGGFTRARVLSFDTLGHEILDQCGGNAVPEVTDLGRQMVLGHLLRRHAKELRYFAAVSHQRGLAAEMDGAFAELERSGKSPADLQQNIDDLNTTGPADFGMSSLAAKLHDMQLIYAAYAAYLGQDRLDPHRRLMHVLSCVESSQVFHNADVYVDGFTDFTDFERKLLARIATTCRSMELTLLADPSSKTIADPHHLPDEMSLFHRTESTYRQLFFAFSEAGAKIDDPARLTTVQRFTHPAITHIETHGFQDNDAPVASIESSGQVELIEASDRRGEVDAAARRINDLLRDGLRLREIAVLVRQLDNYHDFVTASFREHEIPFFVDRRRGASHHPLIQLTRAVFTVARRNWQHEAMMTILKGGLAGLSADEADTVEHYVLTHRVQGQRWAAKEPWMFHRVLLRRDGDGAPQPDPSLEVDALRRKVAEPLTPFVSAMRADAKKPLTVKEFVCELFALFERLGIRQTLSKWMTDAQALGKFEQRGEHEQAWLKLVELFDQMVDLLGEEPVTLDDFIEILDSGLEQFDMTLTPPTVDQVLVGQVDRTRTGAIKCVIVLGLNSGQFPFASRDPQLFSNAERKTLRQRSIELEADSTRAQLDETFHGYFAFTRASERLIVTRAIADEGGRREEPSEFWAMLQRRFTNLLPTALAVPGSSIGSPDAIASPRQLVTALMRWARHSAASADSANASEPDATWPALYQWLTTHACCDDAIDTMRYRAWRALSYSNDAGLSPATSALLFPAPLAATPQQLETYATCPFKHFVQHGLALASRPDPDVNSGDLGQVFHRVLEQIVRQMLKDRTDWAEIESTKEIVHEYVQQVAAKLRGELMLSNGRNQYLLDRIERTLTQVIASQKEMSKRGRFRPAHAGVRFDDNGGQIPALHVATPKGREVVVRGQIDRVDTIADSAEFAVIDYKLTGASLAMERVYHGLSLQLLTYLLVLQANGEQLAGRPLTPAAGFYLQLLRRLDEVKHPDEATDPDDPAFHLKFKPRGILDGQFVSAFDSELTSGVSEVVSARINKDGTFGNRGNTDVADASEIAALLGQVRKHLGEIADAIVDGAIGIAPYRIGRNTPCGSCDFRSVCRFDPVINRYHTLTPLRRDDALRKMVEEAKRGA